ncbi:MAG: spore coat protein [Hamadaea sp.]|uniref:PseG/SpsG family protein n=1 Tax=Hamadaea sp. TaxID=2024425 RepID=UPI001843243A|nr:spore coat protein [Hamadaea sp.]NUR73458.1 spore coat protein [Hamadaea sp.]NUT24237.1 spore coat protein [Hamadaea sp.]
MSDSRIGIRCDAGPTTGVGHLVRGIALAEELTARGVQVVFLGDVGGVGWAERELRDRDLPLLPGPDTPADLVAAARELRLSGLVVDSYTLDPHCAGAVRAFGVPVLAIVDGDTRGQEPDLFLDQNLDAELADVPTSVPRLAGLKYVLLRDSVRRLRPEHPKTVHEGRPKLLAFFGGTDAFGAGPVITRLVLATGEPVDATVVAGSEQLRKELEQLRPGPGQELRVIDPTDRLPEHIAAADVVVSASGTSTWELLCLGAAAAMVWVVDNQWLGYERVMARGLTAGIGLLGDLADASSPAAESAVVTLRELLSNPLVRTELSTRAMAVVDGRGRERVADAFLALL